MGESPINPGNMANDYEPVAARLREKEARLVAELDAVRRSLAALESARVAAGLPSSGYVTPLADDGRAAVPVNTSTVVSDKFIGLGLEQAAAKVLSESDHIELTGKQIWNVLAAAGYSLLSDRPEQSVSWALRKREKKVGDVILIGDGKWGMVDWYSQGRLKELREMRNNASGRNSVEHVAKTKAGIANARRNRRMDNWGPRRKITGDKMALAFVAYQSGAKSKLACARAGKMAWPTFAFYWQTFEMEKWRPGDAFPPPRRVAPKRNQEIVFEEMWPRENGATHIDDGATKKDTIQRTIADILDRSMRH